MMKHFIKQHILSLCLLGATHVSFAQTVQFLSSEDSLPVRVSVFVYHNKERINHWNAADGKVDFSRTPNGHSVEVMATGFETRTFEKVDNIPAFLYLHKKSKHIEEFVVTGQMQHTSVSDAVQNVRIINAKKIEQMGAQNLTQLFKNELNIQLSPDAILGTGMDLQGISGENVKILIDGVPIIGRLNGTIDLDQINIQNVEKIEIIEGPLSVNYGSDALAGTINIITKNSSASTVNSKLYGYYESNGTYNSQLNVSTKIKNTWISADFNRNYFDGWNDTEKPFHVEKKRLADTTRNKLYKPREQLFGGLKIRQTINTKHEKPLIVTADLRLFSEEIENRGTPSKPYYIIALDDFYRTLRSDNSLSISGQISKRWAVNSTHSYNLFERKKTTFVNNLTRLEKKVAGPNEQDTSTFDLVMSRTSFIYQHSDQLMLEMGYDINAESSRGKRIKDQMSNMTDYALFASAEYAPTEKLIIKPGLRIAQNTVYNPPVVPSLFVKYQLTKNNHLRASYSRGYRAPSLKELYYYFVDINHNIKGNENLKAEMSNNYQVSLRTDYEKGNCRIVISNQFFFNDLDNLITLAQIESSESEYSYINLTKAQTVGYTLNATFVRKGFSTDAGASLKARGTQIRLNEPVRYNSMYPEIKVNPSYTFGKANTSLSVFYKFTGKRPNFVASGDQIYETKRESYHTFDFTVQSYFWKQRIGITAGVKNAFDVTRIKGISGADSPHGSGSSSVLIGMGRTYFCSIVLNINTKK